MTTAANLSRLSNLQKVWENEPNKRPRILPIVQRIATVSGNKIYCKECKKPIVGLPSSIAVGPGHIYSPDGLADYFMNGYCEFCYDVLMHDPTDYEDLGVYVVEAIEARED